MKDKNNWKNKIYFVLVVALIIMALLIPFVFAVVPIEQMNEEKQFFSVDSTNKIAGSTLEMSINLDVINYDSFIFTLENVDKTFSIDTNEIENVEIEESTDGLKITGNKENINFDSIKLLYKIPENIEVGTTLTFLATIEENVQNEDIKQTLEITINIVENDEGDNKNEEDNKDINNGNNSNKQEQDNNQNPDKTQQNQDNLQERSKQEQNIQSSSQINGSTEMTLSSNAKSTGNTAQSETVTYNGSSNNYLKTLNIEGYEFTKEFSKENTTYFIKIDENIDSLKVKATSEDDNAIICIYGNENIEEGSKILISVTAENGNVRVYRIYAVK